MPDYRVKLLVNEREIGVPSCSDLYCPLKEFMAIYEAPIYGCDFLRMCDIKPCQDDAKRT